MQLKIQPLLFRVPNHLKAICLFWHWFLSVPPAFFCMSLWSLKLCIDVGRVAGRGTTNLSTAAEPWLMGRGALLRETGLGGVWGDLWCNTSCGRNLPLVCFKDLVPELLTDASSWRSVVPALMVARTTAALLSTGDRGCQVGPWQPQAGNWELGLEFLSSDTLLCPPALCIMFLELLCFRLSVVQLHVVSQIQFYMKVEG